MKREKKPIKKLISANQEGERPRNRANRYGKINSGMLLKMLDQGKSQRECAKFFGVSPAAICTKLKKVAPMPIPESLKKLTKQQQKFVIEKVSGKTSTQAALSSFEVSSLDSAKSIGVQLGKKKNIQVAIQDLLDLHLPLEHRVERLRQWVDFDDPNASLKALDMSFKLEGSYAPEKNVSLQMTYIQDYRDRMALRAEIAALQKEFDELNGKTPGADDPGEVIEGQYIPEANETPTSNEAPVTPPKETQTPDGQDRES